MDAMFVDFFRAANFVDAIMSIGCNIFVAIIKFVNFVEVHDDRLKGK